MTEKQIKSVVEKFNGLNNFLKLVQNQPHIKNKDVVEEIRLNIETEIERLISLESEDEEEE